MTDTDYSKVVSLEGLAGMRAKLSMYLGGTGSLDGESPRALRQIFQELVSNSLDEYASGWGEEVHILHNGALIGVLDSGRGLPVSKRSCDELVRAFTVPHTSGKFDDSAYSALGVTGTHGIGVKAVNAASRHLVVATKRNDSVGVVEFSCGELVTRDLRIEGLSGCTLTGEYPGEVEAARAWLDGVDSGTVVLCVPDDGPISDDNPKPVLGSNILEPAHIERVCRVGAMLSSGVTLRYIRAGAEPKVWCFDDGLKQYLSESVGSDDVYVIANAEVPLGEGGCDGVCGFDVALCVGNVSGSGSLETYVNGVATSGGTHVVGLRSALSKVGRDVVKGATIDDVVGALDVVAHVRVPSGVVEFEGQTKDVLATPSVRPAIYGAVVDAFTDLIHDVPDFGSRFGEVLGERVKSRVEFEDFSRKSKTLKGSEKKRSLRISSKLKAATSNKPAERELYIVEGDSASNIGRDPRFQAVLPLRGKPINPIKSGMAKALANEEVATIVAALGAGYGKSFDVSKLSYGKVIVASDADVDGFHIRALLTGLFHRMFPGLIESGHLYVALSPLYKATRYVKGKPVHRMFYSEAEMSEARGDLDGFVVTRFKGLGEMSVAESREALANPETRRLVRLTIGDVRRFDRDLTMLLGKSTAERSAWIGERFGVEGSMDEED